MDRRDFLKYMGAGAAAVALDSCTPEAVKKAEINLKSAGVLKKTDLINKDFFEFKSTHLFDEIITDMPFVTDQKSLFDIEKIYEAFFDKVEEGTDVRLGPGKHQILEIKY